MAALGPGPAQVQAWPKRSCWAAGVAASSSIPKPSFSNEPKKCSPSAAVTHRLSSAAAAGEQGGVTWREVLGEDGGAQGLGEGSCAVAASEVSGEGRLAGEAAGEWRPQAVRREQSLGVASVRVRLRLPCGVRKLLAEMRVRRPPGLSTCALPGGVAPGCRSARGSCGRRPAGTPGRNSSDGAGASGSVAACAPRQSETPSTQPSL
mmetsp:Transcript_49269/g.142795  ORF Transcript_49269/g.142795 Transcript_49269/m.142795 type:complete len:206 (-) Transcript_49269:460-1077(-)